MGLTWREKGKEKEKQRERERERERERKRIEPLTEAQRKREFAS